MHKIKCFLYMLAIIILALISIFCAILSIGFFIDKELIYAFFFGIYFISTFGIAFYFTKKYKFEKINYTNKNTKPTKKSLINKKLTVTDDPVIEIVSNTLNKSCNTNNYHKLTSNNTNNVQTDIDNRINSNSLYSTYFLEQVKNQIKESNEIINKTTNPETFFNRLNFLLDKLLFLSQYEDNYIINNSNAIKDYNSALNNIETLVNNFIDRSYNYELEKASKLKTDKGKQDRIINYFKKLEICFGNANEYWTGNNIEPHYSGRLFTDGNLLKIAELENNLGLTCKDLV